MGNRCAGRVRLQSGDRETESGCNDSEVRRTRRDTGQADGRRNPDGRDRRNDDERERHGDQDPHEDRLQVSHGHDE